MESKFAIRFRHWIKANPRLSASYELKDSRGKNSIPFSEVTEHQLNYGMAIKGDKGVFMRMQAVSEGMPDYVYLRNSPAYIVIKFPTFFTIIDVANFIHEKETSKRKSLTSTRAKEIATTTVKLST